MKALPLWVNLLAAGLYLLVFTGSWMLVQDLKRRLDLVPDPKALHETARKLGSIAFQRIVAAIAGLVFLGLYFFNIPLNTNVGILAAAYWLYCMLGAGAARASLQEAEEAEAASLVAPASVAEASTAGGPAAGPANWHALLVQKAQASPAVRQKLAYVMWLDAFLMPAIRANPGREFPEMQRAWQLCIEIACDLGIPEQEGADWVSNYATPIGKELGLHPLRPTAG